MTDQSPIKDQTDAVLAYWSEHRQQLRQSEDQRAVLTNYVLVIASALTGLIAQQKLARETLPVAILIMILGIYGAITVAKYCCATLIMRMSATLILGMSWLWKTPPEASGGAGWCSGCRGWCSGCRGDFGDGGAGGGLVGDGVPGGAGRDQ